MPRRSFTQEQVAQLRDLPLTQALARLELYVSIDRDFAPMKDKATQRWYVTVGGSVLELLVTGEKWFDVRAGKGGGGSIDLTMHLLQLTFVQAVKRLQGAAGDDQAADSSA